MQIYVNFPKLMQQFWTQNNGNTDWQITFSDGMNFVQHKSAGHRYDTRVIEECVLE